MIYAVIDTSPSEMLEILESNQFLFLLKKLTKLFIISKKICGLLAKSDYFCEN